MLACVAIALGCNGFVGTAGAAGPPPSNDLISGATAIPALPFTDTVDTTGATTDATDVQANNSCGAPFTNNSVWYTFTAGPGDTALAVDTTGSTFSSGVIIATGTPGALTTRACSPVSSRVATTSGTTYYIMVFADFGSGGTLHLSVHGPGPVPANDKIGNAIPIAPLPFKTTLDTSGATTDFVDTQANQSCGAPRTGNSVWYKFTPGLKHNLAIDAFDSDYDAGVLVATADEGVLKTVTCGPLFVVATMKPHTTYYVMVFDAFGEGGGTLRLNISDAPTGAVHVQKYAHVDSQGTVQLTGTYSCRRASSLRFSGNLVQIVGDEAASGQFGPRSAGAAACNGGPHPWSALVVPAKKPHFVAGKAAVIVSGLVCGESVCMFLNDTSVVRLGTRTTGNAVAARVVRHSTRIAPRVTRRNYGNARHASIATWDARSGSPNETSKPPGRRPVIRGAAAQATVRLSRCRGAGGRRCRARSSRRQGR